MGLLIYTSLTLGEVTKPSFKKGLVGGETGGSHQFMLGLANFAFPHSPCNVNQSAGCQQGTGRRLAGDALLSCSFDPPSFTLLGFLGGHRTASTFFLLE